MAGSPQPAPGPWPNINAPLIDWARAWCARGYRPIPLEPGNKKTIVKNWPQVRFEQNLPLYFDGAHANRNLGIACGEPSGHVDIDLDSGEAMALWQEFFGPPTGLIYGRASKPSSHWFYDADAAIISTKFQGLPSVDPQTGKKIAARTILEVRGLGKNARVGLQSMVPPSIHPSGERVLFEPGSDGDASRVDSALLQQAAARCAAAILFAWYFPAPGGGRHDAFLALAGVLYRAQWDVDDIVRFHSAVYRCLWAQAADLAAARREVEDTCNRLAAGSTAVTGFPKLSSLIDAKVLQKAFGWLGVAPGPTGQTAGASTTGSGAGGSGTRTSGTKSGVPDGFRIVNNGSKPGVYFDPDDPDEPSVYVCSPLQVLAVAADQEGGSWSRLLRWHDLEGREQNETILMEWLDEPAQLRKLLHDRGLLIASGRKGQELLVRYIEFSTPPTVVRLTDHPGWHERAYVLPGGAIRPSGTEEILFRSQRATEHYYRCAGTFTDWQTLVSAKCSGNSRLLFSMSCAFAAPLVGPLGVEGGGFHLCGDSSLGKSTAQIVAGSAVGGGKRNRKGFTETWRGTANGIEAIGWLHNDNLLLLDEMSLIDPKEADNVSYMLANGSGKLRMSTRITMRPSLLWNLLVLSSGEVRLAEHIATAGKRIRGGAEVRLLNIPADAGCGNGIFEDLHGAPSARQLADDLVEAANMHFGHAQRLFLEKLVKDYLPLVADARQIMNDFLTRVMPKKASAEVGRGLRRIAAVVAAGELATRLGITAWNGDEASWAGGKIFQAWLARRGGTGPVDMDTAYHQVRSYLETYGVSRFEPVNPNYTPQGDPIDPRVGIRAGFWRDSQARNTQGISEREYLFLPETFRAVCQGFDHVAIALELKRRGCLRAGKEKRHPGCIRARTPLGASTPVYCVLERILTD